MVISKAGFRKKDDEVLGALLVEVIDRRRNGESPTASEYALRHPHLRKEIESHFRTISYLEGDAEAGEAGREELEPRMVRLIAGLPPLLRQVIILRNFERRRWEEIARILDRSEVDLRKSYAGAIGDLMAACSDSAGGGPQRSGN